MRDCFRNLLPQQKSDVHHYLLGRTCKKYSHRKCLLNMFRDQCTPDKDLGQIFADLLDKAKYKHINLLDDNDFKDCSHWVRKAGTIRIPMPQYLISIQRVDRLEGCLKTKFYSNQVVTGRDADFNTTFENSRDSDIPLFQHEYAFTNIWVSWDHDNPNQLPQLYHRCKIRPYDVVNSLGLTYVNLSKHQYLGIVFDSTKMSNLQLYRPGWGDATWYAQWEPVSDPNAPHGWTAPIIHSGSTLRQPEAVGEKTYFSYGSISDFHYLQK